MENGTSAGISYLQNRFWYYDVIGSGINRFVSLKSGGPGDCAVYPAPAGALTIPYSLAGFPVKYVNGFQNCTGLTAVDIPHSVVTIWSNAFRGCSNLGKVTIGDGIDEWTDINNNAFANCPKLSLVTVPDALYQISSANLERVFAGHSSLFTANGSFCYRNSSGNYYRQWGDDGNLWKFEIIDSANVAILGASGIYAKTVPLTLAGIPVTSIADNAFNGCTSLATLRIPRTVESIGENAFNSAGLATVYVAARDTARVKALFVASGLDSAFVDTIAFIEDAPEYWNIRFVDIDDGSVIDIYEREPNTALGELPDPTKPYSNFLGWYTAGNVEVTSETLATADVTYYAHFEPVRYVVSISDPLNPSGGQYWTVEHGHPLSESAYFNETPVHSGYVFLGWVTEDGEEIDLDAPLTAGIVIYLKWAKELEIGLVKVVDCSASSSTKTARP